MRKVGQSKTTRTVLGVVVGLALLGGAFYGGRVYQNNVDQKLFTAYNPPQSGTGRGAAFGNGGGTGSFGGGQNSQISAALAVGTPPAAAGSSSTPTTNSGNSGQNSSAATGSSGTGASSGASASARPLTGQLASLTASKVTVQSFQGQQSLPLTAATRLYRVESASAHSLTVGQAVAISPDRTDTSTAASVTIAPSGGPFVMVRSFGGFGGSGRAGSSGGSGGGFGSGGSGGGFGSGGSGGGFGSGGGSNAGAGGGTGGFGAGAGSGAGGGFRRAAATTGTISGLGNGTLTLKTAQGASKTLKLTSSTTVYRAVEATRSQFKSGTFVSVRPATVGGRQVAADVVASSASSAIASIAS